MPMNIAVFMVRHFGGASTSEQQVSRYTGLLAASMTGAQFLTSFAWGRCSDVIGRKPVMLIGNLAGAFGMLALGCSPTFVWAVTSRFISGLLNGTSVVVKTIIGESCDSTQQAQAMGVISLAWGLGGVCGPLIGGLLSHPCRHAITSSYGCEPGELLQRQPFLLPCGLVGLALAATAAINAYALEETLPCKCGTAIEYSALEDATSGEEDLLDSVTCASDGPCTPVEDSKLRSIHVEGHFLPQPSTPVSPARLQPYDAKVLHSNGDSPSRSAHIELVGLHDSSPEESARLLDKTVMSDAVQDSPSEAGKVPRSVADAVWYRHPTVLLALGANGLAGLCFSFMDEVTPIFASAPIHQGGLALLPEQLAMPMAFGGVALTVFALLVYPKLQPRLGMLWTCRSGLLCFVPAAVLTPCASLFVSDTVPERNSGGLFFSSQVVLYVTQSARGISGIMALTGATVIVNVLAPDGQLGSVVGAGQTLLNLVRALGPALAGIAWALSVSSTSPGHQFWPFVSIAVVSFGTAMLFSRRLPLSAVEGQSV